MDNIGGFKAVTLEKAYNGLSSAFHLRSKGDFGSKFGTHQAPVRRLSLRDLFATRSSRCFFQLYIHYPKGALGVKGIEAIC